MDSNGELLKHDRFSLSVDLGLEHSEVYLIDEDLNIHLKIDVDCPDEAGYFSIKLKTEKPLSELLSELERFVKNVESQNLLKRDEVLDDSNPDTYAYYIQGERQTPKNLKLLTVKRPYSVDQLALETDVSDIVYLDISNSYFWFEFDDTQESRKDPRLRQFIPKDCPAVDFNASINAPEQLIHFIDAVSSTKLPRELLHPLMTHICLFTEEMGQREPDPDAIDPYLLFID